MTKIINTSDVSFRDRRVFFDTNIWLMLEGYESRATQNKLDAYSSAYKSIIRGGNHIVINELVLSEFCHRCGTMAFENAKNRDPSLADKKFKHFRNRPAFKAVLNRTYQSCMNILDSAEFVSFSGLDCKIDDVLELFRSGAIDFTDILISQFCIKEACILMSDDRDFMQDGLNLTQIRYCT